LKSYVSSNDNTIEQLYTACIQKNKQIYGTSEYNTTEKSGLEVEENKLGN